MREVVRTPDTLSAVPNEPKTPHRSVRISDERWQELGEVTAAMGTDRAKVLNELAAWWLREPNAKLPKRPPVDES